MLVIGMIMNVVISSIIRYVCSWWVIWCMDGRLVSGFCWI